MTRLLTRIFIVVFQVLLTPLVVDPRSVVVRPEFRRGPDNKVRFSYWWKA